MQIHIRENPYTFLMCGSAFLVSYNFKMCMKSYSRNYFQMSKLTFLQSSSLTLLMTVDASKSCAHIKWVDQHFGWIQLKKTHTLKWEHYIQQGLWLLLFYYPRDDTILLWDDLLAFCKIIQIFGILLHVF